MKLMLSYFLLGLYAIVMVKPIVPQVADGLAHVLNYADHVRIVHKEKGELHVHYEYASQAEKDNARDSSNDVSKQFNASAEHFISNLQTNTQLPTDPQEYSGMSSVFLPNHFAETALHPPCS